MLLGLTGVCIYNLMFLHALQQLPASRTSLTVALNPIVPLFGATFSVTLLHEPVTSGLVVGGALSVAGVMLALRR